MQNWVLAILCGALLASSSVAAAQGQWKLIYTSPNQQEFYVDTTPARQDGKYVGVWLKESDFITTANKKKEKSSESLSYYLVNCQQKELSVQKTYSLNNAPFGKEGIQDIQQFLPTASRRKPVSPPTIKNKPGAHYTVSHYEGGWNLSELDYFKDHRPFLSALSGPTEKGVFYQGCHIPAKATGTALHH
jgi:hypothetical protein